MNPNAAGLRTQAARVEGSAGYLRLALGLPPGMPLALSADLRHPLQIDDGSRARALCAGLTWEGGSHLLSSTVSGISPALSALLEVGHARMAERYADDTLDHRDRDPSRYPAVGDLWRSWRRNITLEVVSVDKARGEVRARTQDGREVRRALTDWIPVASAYGTLVQRGGISSPSEEQPSNSSPTEEQAALGGGAS